MTDEVPVAHHISSRRGFFHTFCLYRGKRLDRLLIEVKEHGTGLRHHRRRFDDSQDMANGVVNIQNQFNVQMKTLQGCRVSCSPSLGHH